MKTLLRSTFIADANDNKEVHLRNFYALNGVEVTFGSTEDEVIWKYLQDFVRSFNEVPNLTTLLTHFTHSKEDSIVTRLDTLKSVPAVSGGDFQTRLKVKVDERKEHLTHEMLKDAATILRSGLEIQEGKEKRILRGPIAAIHYVLDNSHDIVAPSFGSRLSGEVTHDATDFKTEYERVEADPTAGVGQHSGLFQIDTAINGAKKHELWIHAAYTGGLKSTLMLNWAYNQSVYGFTSTIIFSLEMPYTQCRRILYAMHSSHPKFRNIRYTLGLQQNVDATVGVPYENIRDGTLNEYHPNARKFLFDYVVPDFKGEQTVTDVNPDTGMPWALPKDYGKIHIEVADPDKNDFTVADLRHRAEVVYSESPFKIIFIDHIGLMAPRKWVSSTTERLNEVVRDCKKTAMSFNRGAGMAVVGLFQINRDGYRTAQKRKDKSNVASYDMTALSYSNECERSADIITAAWMDDDMRNTNRVQFQCLKSRDQKPFEVFLSRVEWPCRRILTCYDVVMTSNQRDSAGDAVDNKAGENQLNA